MGLDNFWLVPQDNEENLEKFYEAKEYPDYHWDSTSPKGVEFDTAEYHGEYPLNLIGGMLSSNGSGSFRGKYYSPLCDAMLKDDGWLYSFRYAGEIREAYEKMAVYLALFQSNGKSLWKKLKALLMILTAFFLTILWMMPLGSSKCLNTIKLLKIFASVLGIDQQTNKTLLPIKILN